MGNFSVILDKVEIYVNADIQVAFPKDLSVQDKNFTNEDVYNPAFGKGGVLKRTVIGFYTAEHGFKVYIPQCKYCDRRNMSNIVLKTEVVVSKFLRTSV